MSVRSPLNSACDCCETPQCGPPYYSYVAVEESCSPFACGEADPEGDPCKLFTKRVITHEDGHTETTTWEVETGEGCSSTCVSKTSCGGTSVATEVTTLVGGTVDYTSTVITTTVYATNDDETGCSEPTITKTCTGSSSYAAQGSDPEDDIGSCSCESSATDSGDGSGTCVWSGQVTCPPDPDSGDDSVQPIFVSCLDDKGLSNSGGTFVAETTYNPPLQEGVTVAYSEEAESEPCTVCPAAPPFPSYSDLGLLRCVIDAGEEWPEAPELQAGQSAGFVAEIIDDYPIGYLTSYDLSINGAVSKRSVKFKLVHPPTASCYLKVWLEKRTTTHTKVPAVSPDCGETWSENDEPEVEGVQYTWNGTGQVCLNADTKDPRHCENLIVSHEFSYDPQPGQEIAVKMIKFSCVKNYVPDATNPFMRPEEAPCKNNGFPTPGC